VKVVDHDAPAEQLNTGELGGASNHLNEVVPLRFILEESNLVGDSTRDVMNRLVLFRSVTRI
jgi:hypothetical protein